MAVADVKLCLFLSFFECKCDLGGFIFLSHAFGALQFGMIFKISVQLSYRGERQGLRFKFFWEPKNKIACSAPGCSLSILVGSYYGKKSPGEFSSVAVCLCSCLVITILIYRLGAS